MRVLLTSDWQLGAGAELGVGEHGPGSRFQDQVDVLDRIADLAIAEGIDLFACLGDVFERSRPDPSAILAVQALVRRLTDSNVRCLFLAGNHDSRGSALPTALEIFAGAGCVVSLLPSLFPLDAIDPDDPGLVIATLPWVAPGSIVAAMPDVDRADVNDTAAQGLVAGAKLLAEQCRTVYPGVPSLLTGHWAVSGATLPTGLPTSMLREPVIPLEGLTDSGFSLAMLGHIHVAGMLAQGPCPVGYCGTPYVCNWAEAEQPHGVWIYETGGAAGSLRFVEVADNKRFVTLGAGYMASVDSGLLLPIADVEGAVVRVRYEASAEQARRINQRLARQWLLDHGAVKVVFRPTVVREERARVAKMTADLSEASALDLWIASQGLNGALADAMRDEHAKYLALVRS